MRGPSDVLWELVAAGVLVGGLVERACEVLDVSKAELRAARARYECPPPEVSREDSRPLPHTSPTTTRSHIGASSWTPAKWRPTTAGARRQADKAFRDIREWVQLRVVQVDCAVCGDPIETGDRVVIERAHHAGCVESAGLSPTSPQRCSPSETVRGSVH